MSCSFSSRVLPLVVHTFGKSHFVLDLYLCAVIQYCRAGYPAENLMRDHAHDLRVYRVISVYYRLEIHLESAVRRSKGPWLSVKIFFAAHRNVESHILKLVRLSVEKQQFSLAALVSPKP